MANTVALETILQSDIIAQLNSLNPILPWANRAFEGELKRHGQTIEVHERNHPNGQYNGTAGGAITATDWTYNKRSLTVSGLLQENQRIADIEQVRASIDIRNDLTSSYAYMIANTHQRHIATVAAKGVHSDNAANAGSPATLSASNAYTTVETLRKLLSKKNAFGDAALFIDPATAMFLREDAKFMDNHDAGYNARVNGAFIAKSTAPSGRVSNFMVYETTSLPFKQKLTIAVNPSDTDTFTVNLLNVLTDTTTSIVFTFKSTANAAGHVKIGASAAATQANLIAALAGTGVGDGTDYFEVTAANRNLLKKYEVTCTSFSSNVGYIYSNDYQNTSISAVTFTSGSNLFGTASVVLIACERNSINFVDQLTKMKVTEGLDGFYSQLPMESVYQAAVLGRNNKRIATSEVVIA